MKDMIQVLQESIDRMWEDANQWLEKNFSKLGEKSESSHNETHLCIEGRSKSN